MTNQPEKENADDDAPQMERGLALELSDRELVSIGQIIAQWGFLEYEIFGQTLLCFTDEAAKLPKELNNLQFLAVLDLWENKVVNNAEGDKQVVLQNQLKKIRHYRQFRDALVHGMWEWDKNAPEKIVTTRIRKKEIITTNFTAANLEEFSLELSKINFSLKYPGGLVDYAAEMAQQGSSMSRRWLCMMTSNPLTDDLFPVQSPSIDKR